MQKAHGQGIAIDFLGDSGAYSRCGKSSSYKIVVGSSQYLVDCGASIFQRVSGHNISDLKGVLITHAHDDHKRHFTDIALFKYYAPDIQEKITLITTTPIHEAIRKSSMAPLSISLSHDSKQVVDIPYEDFVDALVIGPRARYRIREFEEEGEDKHFRPRVVDSDGNVVEPSRAKVVIHPKTNRARILFRDPTTGRWVDPEIYYPFSKNCFYSDGGKPLVDPSGLEITAVTSISWHGVPTTAFRFKTENEAVLITGDTVHSPKLWRSLYQEIHPQRLAMPRKKFEGAYVIHGDINDYIEQAWSPERYEEAVCAFEGSVIIHEVAGRKSIVHTDYRFLSSTTLPRERVILGHSPDIIVSEWILGRQDRRYRVIGNEVFEEVEGTLHPFDADVYYKHYGESFVGYRSPKGNYWVYDKEGLLYVSCGPDAREKNLRYRIDLFQDINGEYYPVLESEKHEYRVRKDGRVELLEVQPRGSRGTVVEGMRGQLPQR